MNTLTVGLGLMIAYVALTLLTPPVLSQPKLLVVHPRLCIRLWLVSFFASALALSSALGIFIARALRHHVVHIAGHDALAPLVDQLLGWLAIAVVGIIAFRMGVAVQDAREAVSFASGTFDIVLATAEERSVGGHRIFIVDAAVVMLGARAGRVVATTSLVACLSPEQLAAVVEHEWAHISHHHARVIAIANIAEAVAPALTAGRGFASAARITTELIADDAAASRYGDTVTADAIEAAYPSAPGIEERVVRLRNRAR